jgi:23S rRNA pseudouridine1911/1915/1917 synthase
VNPEVELVATGDDRGKRLDKLLAEKIDELSRSRLQQLVKNADVMVNCRVVTLPRHRVSPGDVIRVKIPLPVPVELSPVNIPLDIIHEDRDIVVVNKPPGLVVHPGAGREHDTLVHALLFHCSDLSGIGGEIRPGIVHRLDKDTSGIIVCAKNDAAHLSLASQFRKRKVSKTYYAVVSGHMDDSHGRINVPIGRHPVHRKKMAVNYRAGRPALTDWSVRKELLSASLLRLDIHTGRTHQIRVHMHFAGHPVMGDALYGGRLTVVLPEETVSVKRQMLHAARLALTHPASGERVEFSAPLPSDLLELVEKLEIPGFPQR